MRKLWSLPVIALMMIFSSSCDKVTQYYEDDVTFNPDRKVLVEDYTGHKCGNCPRATRSIYDLKKIYGENLIIMAVHAGFFSTPASPQASSYTYDFRTPEGTELNDDFGFNFAGYPNGMVNRRTNSDGSNIFPYTSWADEVSKVLYDFSQVPASISISNDYDDTDRSLTTEVTTVINTDLSSSYRLSVMLVEDHIVNWQKDYDVTPEDIPDYVHREALRESLNGTYGDNISSLDPGDVNKNTYSITLDAEYEASECSIIAFLYDVSTKEIISVEQAKISP